MPTRSDDKAALAYFPDGMLWLEDGHIRAVGPAADIIGQLPTDTPINRHEHGLIIPAERAMADRAIATNRAECALDALIDNGNGTATDDSATR